MQPFSSPIAITLVAALLAVGATTTHAADTETSPAKT